MFDATNLVLFAAASLALVVTPGPDIVYVLTRGIGQGRGTALASTLGVCLGYVVHTALAVLGLSALLASSATAFQVVRYAGAAYLLYLGVRILLRKQTFAVPSGAPSGEVVRVSAVVWQGVLTSVLNPKGILLFVSFLPQFVDPGVGNVALQVSVLGLIHTLLCLAVYGVVALSSGALGNRLAGSPRFSDALRWLTGSVLVGLGLRLALQERR